MKKFFLLLILISAQSFADDQPELPLLTGKEKIAFPELLPTLNSICEIDGKAIDSFFSDKSNGWLAHGNINFSHTPKYLDISTGKKKLSSSIIDLDSDGACEVIAHHPQERRDGDGSAVGVTTKTIIFKQNDDGFTNIGVIDSHLTYIASDNTQTYTLVSIYPKSNLWHSQDDMIKVYSYVDNKFVMVASGPMSRDQQAQFQW